MEFACIWLMFESPKDSCLLARPNASFQHLGIRELGELILCAKR